MPVLKSLFMELLQSLQNIHCIFMTGILSAIPLDAKQSEAGHQAKEKICQTHPWIYAVSRDTFLDRTMSKNSRRNFLNQIEKRKYEMNSTVNVDKEAEAEIDQMVNDARNKLDFHSILGKNKKDAESKQK